MSECPTLEIVFLFGRLIPPFGDDARSILPCYRGRTDVSDVGNCLMSCWRH